MKRAIIESTKSRPFATFQDFAVEVPGFRGELGMFTPMAPAIIIWHEVSKEGIAVLGDMIGKKEIFMHLAPRVSYRDWNLPPVPLCRPEDFPRGGSELKWLPVVFTMGPPFAVCRRALKRPPDVRANAHHLTLFARFICAHNFVLSRGERGSPLTLI
ncbi:MAG TPA: hypothetical protein VK477_13915 [Acidobacteriota bacterium]|nr:hypothetical protein [Acidobacteriota bacterium]